MNYALMNEIMAAHETIDTERVDALLTEFLRDIDLSALPDDLIERYMELLAENTAPVSQEAIDRMHARFEGPTSSPSNNPGGYPRIYDCLEQSLDDADDIGDLGLDAQSLEAVRRDPRPLSAVPRTLRDFNVWLSEGGICLPETLQHRLLKRVRRGYMELAPQHEDRAISLQAARKENRRP